VELADLGIPAAVVGVPSVLLLVGAVLVPVRDPLSRPFRSALLLLVLSVALQLTIAARNSEGGLALALAPLAIAPLVIIVRASRFHGPSAARRTK
jgi:hypothetical protein